MLKPLVKFEKPDGRVTASREPLNIRAPGRGVGFTMSFQVVPLLELYSHLTDGEVLPVPATEKVALNPRLMVVFVGELTLREDELAFSI